MDSGHGAHLINFGGRQLDVLRDLVSCIFSPARSWSVYSFLADCDWLSSQEKCAKCAVHVASLKWVIQGRRNNRATGKARLDGTRRCYRIFEEKRNREMRKLSWIPLLAALLMALGMGSTANAGYCGGGCFNRCPADACAPCGDYCQAKVSCSPGYRTVREIVWDRQNVTCCRTVMDHIVEQVPVTATRNVYETHYRDVCSTIRRPVYQTCYREVSQKVCRPVHQTCYRDVCQTICRPVYQTCYREVTQRVCRPVYNTCYRQCNYTVCRPVYNTCYRDVTCTTWRTESQTCYRDVCYTVRRPIHETRNVEYCTGEWKTETYHVPGPVVTKCVRDPGTWELDPCTGCCCYKPGCCREVQVQCPGTTCCRRVWCPRTETRQVCTTRWVCETQTRQVPYTVCRKIPCTTVRRVPYTTCSMVRECRTRMVPYTTVNYTHECVTRRIPYTTCRMERQCITRRVPYTTVSYVHECITRRIPYTTCSYTCETVTRRVPYTTCRQECYTTTRCVRRCVPRTETYTVARCVPRVVCRQVPVQTCCDPCDPGMVDPGINATAANCAVPTVK